MSKRTVRGAFVREVMSHPTVDSHGRRMSRDAVLDPQDAGRHLQMIATSGHADVDRALLDALASFEGIRRALANSAPPPVPPFNSPLDVNRELSAERPGNRLDLGTVWTGLQGVTRQIEAVRAAMTAAGVDALEEEADLDNRTRDEAAGRAVWSNPSSPASGSTQRTADVRAAARAAGVATDMRTRIRAVNEASKALWRRDTPAP